MTGIIIVGAIGLICAILLVVASHFLSVPIDTRVEDIRGFLPGANCGACGYAGCDDYAKAVANGSAKPNLCIPGGASVSAQISEYLGVAAENTEPVKATVRCSGTCEKCGEAEDYHGPATCAACAALHRGKKPAATAAWAMEIASRSANSARSPSWMALPWDESLCTGCGACAKPARPAHRHGPGQKSCHRALLQP
ncbi:MAG: RnfABCDGE type electron transport complex subunit B [Angelakisella sp.]